MRIELFFKTAAELSAAVTFHKEALPWAQAFNLPNKVRNDNLFEVSSLLRLAMPGSHICVHYSMKNNKSKRAPDTVDALRSFLCAAPAHGIDEVMVVSGGGRDKIAANSLYCLQQLAQQQQQQQGVLSPFPPTSPTPTTISPIFPPISVAFNPYLPNEEQRQEERDRLVAKLDTGLVSRVYLQFGTDAALLEEGLRFLQGHKEGQGGPVDVVGSVFLPSKQLLARFRFRPVRSNFNSTAS
ncbi:hypothetical protein B484DRAFT_366824 [Ochromonadaceae sp. CCMP2298]|nr:hypothetical protein B484DRAFT_366824 [Ochromonadaceae sp. CCMP2298]